uniref:DM domain-containing protein n=1 Tax=Syphacia muris TaxID=451379 RepID=A0A0N5AFD2_9BILA
MIGPISARQRKLAKKLSKLCPKELGKINIPSYDKDILVDEMSCMPSKFFETSVNPAGFSRTHYVHFGWDEIDFAFLQEKVTANLSFFFGLPDFEVSFLPLVSEPVSEGTLQIPQQQSCSKSKPASKTHVVEELPCPSNSSTPINKLLTNKKGVRRLKKQKNKICKGPLLCSRCSKPCVDTTLVEPISITRFITDLLVYDVVDNGTRQYSYVYVIGWRGFNKIILKRIVENVFNECENGRLASYQIVKDDKSFALSICNRVYTENVTRNSSFIETKINSHPSGNKSLKSKFRNEQSEEFFACDPKATSICEKSVKGNKNCKLKTENSIRKELFSIQSCLSNEQNEVSPQQSSENDELMSRQSSVWNLPDESKVSKKMSEPKIFGQQVHCQEEEDRKLDHPKKVEVMSDQILEPMVLLKSRENHLKRDDVAAKKCLEAVNREDVLSRNYVSRACLATTIVNTPYGNTSKQWVVDTDHLSLSELGVLHQTGKKAEEKSFEKSDKTFMAEANSTLGREQTFFTTGLDKTLENNSQQGSYSRKEEETLGDSQVDNLNCSIEQSICGSKTENFTCKQQSALLTKRETSLLCGYLVATQSSDSSDVPSGALEQGQCRKCMIHSMTRELLGHYCPYKNCDCGKCVSLNRRATDIRKVIPTLFQEVEKVFEKPAFRNVDTNRMLPIAKRYILESLESLESCSQPIQFDAFHSVADAHLIESTRLASLVTPGIFNLVNLALSLIANCAKENAASKSGPSKCINLKETSRSPENLGNCFIINGYKKLKHFQIKQKVSRPGKVVSAPQNAHGFLKQQHEYAVDTCSEKQACFLPKTSDEVQLSVYQQQDMSPTDFLPNFDASNCKSNDSLLSECIILNS